MAVKVHPNKTSVDIPNFLTSPLAHYYDPPSQTYNVNPSVYPKSAAAAANAAAGISKFLVTFDGDSITAGFQILGSTAASGARQTNTFAELVRSRFAGDSWRGTVYEGGVLTHSVDSTNPSYGAYDDRLTWDANCNLLGSGGYFGPAGKCALGSGPAGTGGVITYGPVMTDHFDIYDKLNGLPAGSGWTWKVDGGAGTFVAQAGGTANRKTTVSAGTYGSHTLTITFPSTAGTYGVIWGIGIGNNSDPGGMTIARRGVGGAFISDGTSDVTGGWNGPISFDAAFVKQRPDLSLICLGTNYEIGQNPATWKANMITYIQAIQATGTEVALITPPPGGQAISGAQRTYIAALAPLAYQICDQLNIGLWDWYTRWGGSNNASLPQYFWQPGSYSGHPDKRGHRDAGVGAYSFLSRILG